VAELTTIGRPALLVPLPHALDNDQLENATRLEQAGGGWCVKQSELTDERLARLLQDLLSSPERLAKAAEKSHAMATPDAVKRLADMVEALVKSKEQA
jgi:UDP-N-acetylglucosamine--N-acetylmuramyl-(pentapeptide) pyrophosphoryl-undecaprenol N-acetylglucosamine transferase